jgi:hypothetical protein
MNPIVAESALKIVLRRCHLRGEVGNKSRALAAELSRYVPPPAPKPADA